MLGGLLRSENQTQDVQIKYAAKRLFGDRLERTELVNAGVVDENVEPAECFLGLSEELLDIGLSGYVGARAIALPPLWMISPTTRSAASWLDE